MADVAALGGMDNAIKATLPSGAGVATDSSREQEGQEGQEDGDAGESDGGVHGVGAMPVAESGGYEAELESEQRERAEAAAEAVAEADAQAAGWGGEDATARAQAIIPVEEPDGVASFETGAPQKAAVRSAPSPAAAFGEVPVPIGEHGTVVMPAVFVLAVIVVTVYLVNRSPLLLIPATSGAAGALLGTFIAGPTMSMAAGLAIGGSIGFGRYYAAKEAQAAFEAAPPVKRTDDLEGGSEDAGPPPGAPMTTHPPLPMSYGTRPAYASVGVDDIFGDQARTVAARAAPPGMLRGPI